MKSPWKCRGTELLSDCGMNQDDCFVSFSSLSIFTLSIALDSELYQTLDFGLNLKRRKS